jgi:tetratricopeptide (TPR) repeat protein
MTKIPKICLNMIVKNECRIIERLLNSVLPIIDTYCICDTGSTDNTTELIQHFFKQHNILGKIINEPFRDFGYNRTYALNACIGMENADYLLLLDADMVLQIPPKTNIFKLKQKLIENDAFYVFQGNSSFIYKNVRLIRNNAQMEYWGVTHEYIKFPENSQYTYGIYTKDEVFILDIGDGGAKTNKYTRDIELLKRGLEELPNNERYLFYLANSYYNSGQFESAIETYKKRIATGGWIEEIWNCYLNMGMCYKELGKVENAICSWLDGWNALPERIENLYEIVKYYRCYSKNISAYLFYSIANNLSKKCHYDHLFLQKDIYDYKLDYELSIVGFYHNPEKYDLVGCCMKLLTYPTIEQSLFTNVLCNYKYYSPKLDGNVVLIDYSTKLMDDNDFISSTPSICIHNRELVLNTRYVNYRINADGSYDNKESIKTINIISRFSIDTTMKKVDEFILEYDHSHDNIYVGLEDVRLFSYQGKLLYNANRGLGLNKIMVEHGQIDILSRKTIHSKIFDSPVNNENEKNWVLFEWCQKLKCIHSWNPIIIGDLQFNFMKTHQVNSPLLFNVIRGSTNGIIVEDEIWFLCHVVSYENIRYYYHILVCLDKNTLELKRFSNLFTFSKERVEYTLGFIQINPREFLVGYSLMDKKTEFMIVQKTYLESIVKSNWDTF